MKTEALLKELQRDFELKSPFMQEASGEWIIPVEDHMILRIKDLSTGFFLHCNVIETPVGKEEALYKDMLSANLFGQGTKGAVLSLSDEGGHLIISRVIDYDVSYKEFKEILDDFISAIDFWREEALNYRDN